jgi:hypothetical protein
MPWAAPGYGIHFLLEARACLTFISGGITGTRELPDERRQGHPDQKLHLRRGLTAQLPVEGHLQLRSKGSRGARWRAPVPVRRVVCSAVTSWTR